VLSFLVLLTYLNWLRSETRLRDAVAVWSWTTAVTAALYAGVTCWQRFVLQHPAPLFGPYPPTASELSVLFEAALPMQVSLLLARPAPRPWRAWLPIGLVAGAVLMTESQAAWFTAALGVALVLLGRAGPLVRRRVLIGALLATVAAAGLLWAAAPLRALALEQLSGRDKVWAAALEATRQHPFTGVGPGAWTFWFSDHFVSADFLLRDQAGNPFFLSPLELGGEAHQLFLTKAAEMGWPSVIGLMAILACWFRASRRALGAVAASGLRPVAIGGIATMAALLFHGLFENGPIIGKARGAEVLIVWLLAALPLAAGALVRRR
jgi:O-antigen ligase